MTRPGAWLRSVATRFFGVDGHLSGAPGAAGRDSPGPHVRALDQQANVAVAWIPNHVFLAMTRLLLHRPFVTETPESQQ